MSYFYRRFAKLLESTFSISFAVQILLITICLSMTLVQVSYLQVGSIRTTHNAELKENLTSLAFKLSTQLHDSAQSMRNFVLIMAQLFHLFCFSLQGQKLINHSLETRDNM